MSIVKLFRKLYSRAKPKRALAFIAVVAMVASLIQPASIAHAADDTGDQRQVEKIESFTGKLVRGATLEKGSGKYIWNARTDADDHRFTFRVDFSLSGVKELAPGAIKIWIPKTILKDRDGKYADYMDLSYPSEDEYREASEEDKKDADYIWKGSTDEAHKNCIEITNVKKRTAGENGYFEVSYITNKQTFEYKDEVTYKDGKYVINTTPQSDPFYADISVTNTSEGAPQTVTATTDKIPVYINTTAEIESTTKKYPNRLYKEWQSSWGTQPENTKGMYFLVWQIVSDIKEPTQPFTFTLEDTPVSPQLKLIGYSMDKESGPFTDRNYVEHQRSDDERYDYVLTYYDPNDPNLKDLDQYKLKNSVKATVTPEDKIDAPTSAVSQKEWEWDTPKFARPPGHFYGLKFGDGSWDHLYSYNQKYEIANTHWKPTYGPYHDYSDYELDKFQKGEKKSIDTFAYGINVYGFPAPWTVKNGGDPFNPDDYQKKPVKYELTDEELYLNENIKAQDIGADQLKFTFPENVRRLNGKDYQFLSAEWEMHSEWRTFDKDDQKFVISSGSYSEDDIVHFWVKSDKTGTDKYTEVASYNLGKNEAHIDNADVVASLSRNEIKYQEGANVTGIRFTTSNPYWFTNLSATPMVRLKNSDFVMNNARDGVKDRDMIRLHNFSHSDAYSLNSKNEWEHLYGLKNYGYDRAIRPKRESEITKHIASTGSDKVRKKYIIRWKIRQKETLTTNEGTDYLTQKSGKFYDLLPKGLHLQKGSVDVETEKGLLSHPSFSYSIEEDYRGSGRDMVTVEIPVGAKYYNLYFSSEISWTDIKDYGTGINNPVAYETGNKEIYDGYPDDDYVNDSGAVHKLPLSDVNKAYMTKLDSDCTTKRFLYNQEPHDIDTITAAVSGLKKQIKDSRDASYSYETYTTTNGSYSYKIRFANTMTDKAKNLIFFDSLENYNLNGKHSDWHGFLKRFDVSQLKQMGIDPVIYVSKTADLSIDDHHDITDTSVWEKVTKDTNLSEVHAFAIDCRKTSDGKDFILNEGESISAVVYMKAPESVSEVKGEYAKAYNNIYIQDTIMSGTTESTFFIHQDYTVIAYRVEADIRLHKQNAKDANEAVEGAKYKLSGKSDYGTEVNEEVTTGAQGDAVFEGIQKGTYTLKESYSPDDWLLDRTEYTVKVDGTGRVTCNGKEAESKKIIMKDSPRIHGNISFQKLSTVDNDMVKGAKFRLSGKSKYGNEIMMYATSGANGKVRFDNVEYGSYKIKEVETPQGYISVSKEYDASVSDTGFGSIDDAETLSDGTKVIRNEPYHTVEISKQSSYGNHDFLSGAEFRMTGTSSYGRPYDRTAVSGSDGISKFTEVESGKYVLQEIKAPADHIIDTTKHMVDVKSNGKYSISGLEPNSNGILAWYNAHDTGKIIVRKKWKDVDKSKRPDNPPVIHITTDIKDVPTYVEWRKDRNFFNDSDDSDNKIDDVQGAFASVDIDYKSKVKKVEYAKSTNQVPANATRLDKNFNDPDARFKIYGWLTDDGTMYYWTNAQKIRMTNEDRHLFTEMKNMKSVDLSRVDVSHMMDMSYMFYGCCLTSLDMSGFKKAKPINTSHMFGMCSNLESINLTPLDTSKVTDMSYMFSDCYNLKSLDVTKLDTSSVTNMSHMFYCCYSSDLTSLDVSNFDTSKVTSMSWMFGSCRSLASLDVSKFDTTKVTDMSYMFYDSNMTSLDLSNFDTSNVTSMRGMFCACNLTSLDLSSFSTSKVTDMSVMFGSCFNLASLNVSKFDTSHVTEMSDMFEYCSKLTSLDVTNFNTSNVTDMSGMFENCDSLTSLDVSNFDTSKVTNMSRMFNCYYGSSLTSLDLSKFDTSNVTDMHSMFYGCRSLASLDVSNFDTSNVTKMNGMFYDCCIPTSLDVSKFNTSNVTDMSDMFESCYNLTSLDLSNFDTSKVTDMDSMFSGCSSLTSLDVSNWSTSSVTDMEFMFFNCYSLTSLDLSNFDTSKVTDMSNMFEECSSLTSLDLSSWNTSSVTDMVEMFYYCSSLTSLDLSSFDTSKVTKMESMFYRCSKLTNIYVSDKWNTDKVTSSDSMFYNCSKLSNYSSSSTDKTHANYGSDGYLTYKAVATAKVNTSNTSFASRLVSMIMSRLAVPVYAADSASYVSTDTDHCKITKDGDTWTYEFTVADGSAKYYAYEEDVEGYTSSNDVNSYGITAKDEPLTITNTANELPQEPKPASLSLSKTADGKQLTDRPVEKYSHTSNIDDAGKANGQYSNDLNTNGDVVIIPGASKLHVKLYCSTEPGCDWACVWVGSHPNYTADENYSSSKLGTKSGKIGGGWETSMSDITPIEGDIDGDTVTFGFRSDSSIGYYGYYAVVTGKDADGNAIKMLSDTDIADIPSSYSDMAYMFDITLKNSDSSKLSGTKIFGDAVFTDGKARVGLKAGETKTFSDLPGGTSYAITEKKYDDFFTESKNASGTLKAGGTAEAKFTNHYQNPKTPDTPKEHSNFTLKKELTGYYDEKKHKDQNFTFDVSLKKLDPDTEYTLSDGKTKFTSDADGYGYVQTKLSDKESVTFIGLPVGAQYRITEEGGDWSSAYKIKNESSEGDISQSADSAEKGQQLSTAWETADKGEDITVDYTNTLKKYQSLVLRKVISGGETPDKFRFRIDFANLHETVRSDAGTIVPEDDGTVSADVYLSAGDEMKFSSIPVTAKYKITEEKNAGKASYEIRVDNGKTITGKNDEPGNDLSTAEETVYEGENATVTFTNIMPKSASITLKKQVDGVFTNKSKFFRFTVSVSNAAKKQSYLIDLTNGSSEYNDGKKNPQYIKTDENGHGSTDIWLKHDDEIVLKNLLLEAKYSIAEDATGYEKTITVNDSAVKEISNRHVADETVVFTNRKEPMILPTGLRSRTAIAMICVAIVFLISIFTALPRITKKGKDN